MADSKPLIDISPENRDLIARRSLEIGVVAAFVVLMIIGAILTGGVDLLLIAAGVLAVAAAGGSIWAQNKMKGGYESDSDVVNWFMKALKELTPKTTTGKLVLISLAIIAAIGFTIATAGVAGIPASAVLGGLLVMVLPKAPAVTLLVFGLLFHGKLPDLAVTASNFLGWAWRKLTTSPQQIAAEKKGLNIQQANSTGVVNAEVDNEKLQKKLDEVRNESKEELEQAKKEAEEHKEALKILQEEYKLLQEHQSRKEKAPEFNSEDVVSHGSKENFLSDKPVHMSAKDFKEHQSVHKSPEEKEKAQEKIKQQQTAKPEVAENKENKPKDDPHSHQSHKE